MELYQKAWELNEKKAVGPWGPHIVHLAKIIEEVGQMMKMCSVAHRKGTTDGWSEGYFVSELADLVLQVDFLCKDHGVALEQMRSLGEKRFQERLELKGDW